MKSYFKLLLCIALCIVLVGCTQQSAPTDQDATEPTEAVVEQTEVTALPENYTFPADTRLHGVDIGSMSFDAAYEAICEKVEQYDLTATVNGHTLNYTGKTLQLFCSEDALYDYALSLNSGEDPENISILTYDGSYLTRRFASALNEPYVNAEPFYNEETGLYELIPGTSGKHIDSDTLMPTIFSAIDALQNEITVILTEHEDVPPISEKNRQITDAVEKANTYLTTEITYNFEIDDDIESVTLSKDLIRSMIDFDSNLNPSINKEKLSAFVDEVNEQYGEIGIKDSFITRAGTKTDMTVTYYAQALDTQAMCEDILYYLEKGISGTRLPPQLDEITPDTIPYRGSYIEIDMTNQVLYLFKDNECLMETPIVTGKVYRHMNTPTGVYKVLTHRMHVVLQGFDYSTYVKYWMQFYRGYGMHDAWWRDEFGGNEYLYNGSHGCVNIPPDNAEFIFNNIDKGYPVIIYGGATNDGPLQQTIVGTDTYNVSTHIDPFQLDAKTAIGNGKLTYKSSNPSVASVSEEGLVTIKKTGNAVITVEYEEGKYYTGATLRIDINVEDPCGDNHTLGRWRQTTPPSCVEGVMTRKCKNCDMYETKPIPATNNHCYGEWVQTVEPKCVVGEERRTCIVCGAETAREIPAEHNLRDWRVREKATCTEPGEEYRTCRRCDYEETEILPAWGHTFYDDEEFCEDCDARNPDWVPPTEAKKEDED